MKFESRLFKDQIVIREATEADVQDLLGLYFSVYGSHYPLELGNDREKMIEIIRQPENLWLVAVETQKNLLVGTAVCEVDTFFEIGRAEGVAMHPDYRRQGLATEMVRLLCEEILDKKKSVASLYTTTRTNSVGPQLTFIRNQFRPFGIFPNAHRLERQETMTLLARHRPEVLLKRKAVTEIPEALGPILKHVDQSLRVPASAPKLLKTAKSNPTGEQLDFEIILAPQYVQRKFAETFHDPFDRFFPFHEPNLLLSAKNGEVEIYGHLNKGDGYCALITATEPFFSMAGRLNPLMRRLKRFGVAYIEILMSMDSVLSLEALLDVNFLPSALYPAMFKDNGEFRDLVLLSRTMEPLNFRGMQIEKSFKPFVDQYVNLWKRMHLEVLGIFEDK